MKKQHLYLLLGILFFSTGLFCREYPEWFLYPKEFPDVIVGYNYRGTDPCHDAAMNYCIYKKCFVIGEQHYYSESEKKFSDYYYYCDKELYDIVVDSIKYIETFMLNTLTKDYISAFSLSRDVIKGKLVDSKLLNIPEWTNKNFYRINDYFYGVGIYTSRGNDPDAWKTAEEESFFSIMTGYHIDMESSKEIFQDDEMDYYFYEQVIKFKYELNNLKIIERFDKCDEQLFYVLSRIHVNDIKRIGEYYEK